MATGKSDDQLIQSDNKLKIGTRSGQFRIGHDCVVSLTSTMSECERTLSRFFSFVSTVSHLAHTHRGSSHESCVCHPCHPHVHEVSVSLRPCSPLLPHALPAALLPPFLALELRGQPAAHSAQSEYGLV